VRCMQSKIRLTRRGIQEMEGSKFFLQSAYGIGVSIFYIYADTRSG
jgi:hypothetical protein